VTKAMPFISAKYVADVQEYLKGYFADTVKHDAAEEAYYRYGQMQFETFGAELASANPTLPQLLFDRELTIRLGRREVQVKFLGRGNTGGDAVVYVPDAKVLATGDLVVHPYPYAIGSFIGEWIETLGRVAAIDAIAIVPGHGAVEHDTLYLGRVVRLLKTVQSRTADAAREGKSLEETQKALDLTVETREFCGPSAWCAHVFRDNFIEPAVTRAYREAKEGKLRDEK